MFVQWDAQWMFPHMHKEAFILGLQTQLNEQLFKLSVQVEKNKLKVFFVRLTFRKFRNLPKS